MKSLWRALFLMVAFTPHLHAREQPQVPPVREIDGIRVVALSGTPYAIGYQHGRALAPEVEAVAERMLGHFGHTGRVSFWRAPFSRGELSNAWQQAAPFIPQAYAEELRGLSDGSGVPLSKLYALHMLSERAVYGAGFAAWNQATVGGRLIHLRNLDWTREAGLQEYAVVFVVRPGGGLDFINIGWAGFIGVFSGINEKRIAVGWNGADSVDVNRKGQPAIFIARDVLQQARDLEQAADLVSRAVRTIGVNYIFSDAYAGKGVIIETTRGHVKVFTDNDPAEHSVAYARPLQNAVLRSDTAVDPAIRSRQTASGGKPDKSGAAWPSGEDYTKRYLGQVEGFQRRYGRIDAETAQGIAREIATDSNVQSVIYAWPEVWTANADAATPAAHAQYRRLDVERLLRRW